MSNNFIKDIIKNANDLIKYKNTVTTGEITADNGDGTYDVKIANAGSAYPDVETINYDAVFSVGEIVDIIFEHGCKESPKIIGHSKKIKQEPLQVEVDYSGDSGDPITTIITLDAFSKTAVSAFLEGKIELSNGAGNCTRRGFHYGLTTAYGSDIHEDGSYGAGYFNKQITGLTGDTTYHFQAYVIDANGDEKTGSDNIMITKSYTLYENYEFPEDCNVSFNVREDWRHAQTFLTTSAHQLNYIELSLHRNGSPTQLNIEIKAADANDNPVGNILASGSIDALTITTSGFEYKGIVLTNYNLSDATKYAIIISVTGGNVSNSIAWDTRSNSSVPYPDGKVRFSTNAGSSWIAQDTYDSKFKIYG